MPRVFFFAIFISAVILVFGLLEVLMLRLLNREWWRRKWIRLAAWSLPIIGVVFFWLAGTGEYYKLSWLALPSAAICALAIVLEVCLMFSLPVSGVIRRVDRLIIWFRRTHRQSEKPAVDRRRRLLLKSAASAVPLVTVATGLSGVGRAYARTRVFKMQLGYAGLPDDLAGLRILHLSDMHLHHYVTLDDLQQVLTDAEPFSPDLVLVTGDIADDLEQLPGALNMISESQPRLGAYAIVGNHEYFRGISRVREIFSESPVPLLFNDVVCLSVGGSMLRVCGIDDPITMQRVGRDFYERCLDAAFTEGDGSEFTVLMSHRPDVFPDAVHRGINLTLAGHTHGGQVGLWGRSLLERYFPDKYLWGHYCDGESQLYTSCGVGHWFPFRLGCPPEAPVIELTSL